MAKTKEWRFYELGKIQLTATISKQVSMEMFFNWAKKTKCFNKGIRTHLPEDRELQISEVRDVASTLKQVLEARFSALSVSDEDVLEEI